MFKEVEEFYSLHISEVLNEDDVFIQDTIDNKVILRGNLVSDNIAKDADYNNVFVAMNEKLMSENIKLFKVRYGQYIEILKNKLGKENVRVEFGLVNSFS